MTAQNTNAEAISVKPEITLSTEDYVKLSALVRAAMNRMPETRVVVLSSKYDPNMPADEPALMQRKQNSKQELDRRLDQALEEIFTASDPVSIIIAF
jgi:predicted GTPase